MDGATVYPPRFVGTPDGRIGTYDLQLVGQLVFLQLLVEEADGVRPQGIFAVCGRPVAVGLVYQVVISDAGKTFLFYQEADIFGSGREILLIDGLLL